MNEAQIAELFALLAKVTGSLDRIGAALERLAQPNAGGVGSNFGPPHHRPADYYIIRSS